MPGWKTVLRIMTAISFADVRCMEFLVKKDMTGPKVDSTIRSPGSATIGSQAKGCLIDLKFSKHLAIPGTSKF